MMLIVTAYCRLLTAGDILTAAQTIAYHNDLLDGFGDGKRWITVAPSSEIAF
jgi:hypothetical protein